MTNKIVKYAATYVRTSDELHTTTQSPKLSTSYFDIW